MQIGALIVARHDLVDLSLACIKNSFVCFRIILLFRLRIQFGHTSWSGCVASCVCTCTSYKQTKRKRPDRSRVEFIWLIYLQLLYAKAHDKFCEAEREKIILSTWSVEQIYVFISHRRTLSVCECAYCVGYSQRRGQHQKKNPSRMSNDLRFYMHTQKKPLAFLCWISNAYDSDSPTHVYLFAVVQLHALSCVWSYANRQD